MPNFAPGSHGCSWTSNTPTPTLPRQGGGRNGDNGRAMCGRITFEVERDDLLDNYAWLKDAPEEAPRYNIAPTDPVLTVGPERAELVRWGIDGRKGGLFNLRSETATA